MRTTTITEQVRSSIKERQNAAMGDYRQLVIKLAEGNDPDVLEIQTILAATGKKTEDLDADLETASSRRYACERLQEIAVSDIKLKEVTEQLKEQNEKLRKEELAYQERIREDLEKQKALQAEIASIKSMQGNRPRLMMELNDSCSIQAVRELRDAGNRKVAAQNHIRSAAFDASPQGIRRKTESLDEAIRNASNTGKRQRLQREKDEFLESAPKLQTQVEHAADSLRGAEEKWDDAVAKSHEWQNFRLSTDGAEDYFGEVEPEARQTIA